MLSHSIITEIVFITMEGMVPRSDFSIRLLGFTKISDEKTLILLSEK